MKKIYQLSQDVIAKIAAGEIVERPCNIVKELVENSLDAGAKNITISVIDGGKKQIIIEDNGHGMDQEDALLAVEHHTTSKLTTENDLVSICTYGFRGEALSSIAAVSHLSLKTKTKHSSEGYHITISGGVITDHHIIAHPVGTSITVCDLFFNTPARQKFLKKENTEINQIKQLFFAYCFAVLDVHFSLNSNERKLYSCSGVNTLFDRFIQLESIAASKHMLTLKKTEEPCTISGIISDTQYVSYDRSDIFIFVNNRWIKNSTLIRALIQGYQDSLPHQKFPRAIIKIDISPAEIDINIHPKKEEVRFLHPRRVEMALTKAVKETLESALPQSTTLYKPHEVFSIPSVMYQQNKSETLSRSVFNNSVHTSQPKTPLLTTFVSKSAASSSASQHKEPTDVLQESAQETNYTVVTKHELHCIGQLFQTYILASNHNTFYLIDQHAAHERILFEKIVNNNQGLLSVTHAFPIMVSLPAELITIIMQYQLLFHACGILFDQFDATTLVISATPAGFAHYDFKLLFEEIFVMLKTQKEVAQERIESHMLHQVRCSIACKSAVKAGDQLDTFFMIQLIADLSITNNRFCCPHGRPTMWEISQYEIEKKFKRK